MNLTVSGNIIDIENREIFQGSIEIEKGSIKTINRHPVSSGGYILPGFIDAHTHIENSLLTPHNLGEVIIKYGTVAIINDPHEIANVIGMDGINFMTKNSKGSPIKTFFTIPSCVPLSIHDRSGSEISLSDVKKMATSKKFTALSEVMNSEDPEIIKKIDVAKKHDLPIDGHAPALSGKKLKEYIGKGITTDHECTTLEEAKKKISLGMKILIREGSASKDYEKLKSLIKSNPNEIMFCTDNCHLNGIVTSRHISGIVKRAINEGFDLFDVLKAACINPINHYKLGVGKLNIGDKADFIVIKDLLSLSINRVFINGVEKYHKNTLYKTSSKSDGAIDSNINNFNHDEISISDLKKEVKGEISVISIVKDELITNIEKYTPKKATTNLESDIDEDILKIVYINRYSNGTPQIAFCKGFGMKSGAMASSVSHDSQNIIAIGCNDEELCQAINIVIANKGALSVRLREKTEILPLPIGGIMSDKKDKFVSHCYYKLNRLIKKSGCPLPYPFVTLSFLSHLIIPKIRIGEDGLFICDTSKE